MSGRKDEVIKEDFFLIRTDSIYMQMEWHLTFIVTTSSSHVHITGPHIGSYHCASQGAPSRRK